MLRFSGAWRFAPPVDNGTIPNPLVNDVSELVYRIVAQGDRHELLEHFKGFFARAAGVSDSWSSSESWAETDLRRRMDEAAANAPLFIEAFYDACETLRSGELAVPDLPMLNSLLARYGLPYRIEPPHLTSLRQGGADVVIAVPERPPTLAERAIEIYQESLQTSERRLAEGRDREAVQEILWLLESVATAFQGVDTATGTVEGTYFNQIVRDLRHQAGRGRALDQILGWLVTTHGYLSAPAGGGVRHGLDLNRGVEITHSEARLYCNLIRSYLAFLLSEHERLVGARA